MRFLCLHGAIGNIDNISIQIDPLSKELETDKAASFCYINGPVRVHPPPGFDEYFGAGPHYRWADNGGAAEDSMISRVRQIPFGQNPEDVMRDLTDGRGVAWHNHEEVMKYLYNELGKDPDIAGLVGYSEGASMAASFIIDEERRQQEDGRERRIKCAVFFTGWPPIRPGKGIVLSDEDEGIIDIPTLHVVGANDPYRHGAFALYNICNPETATFFDTGKGHTIPRSGLVIKELGDAVRDMIAKVTGAGE